MPKPIYDYGPAVANFLSGFEAYSGSMARYVTASSMAMSPSG